jgi:hypothetical protein
MTLGSGEDRRFIVGTLSHFHKGKLVVTVKKEAFTILTVRKNFKLGPSEQG